MTSEERQQAIEWLKRRPVMMAGAKRMYDLAVEALEQPEVIRCKDCDWWTKQPDSAQGRCALLGMYPTGAWYCANARKRGGKCDGQN